MKLQELTKLMTDLDYNICMYDLSDIYNILNKLGSKMPQNLSYEIAKQEAEKYSDIFINGRGLYFRKSFDWNLIKELKVLKIVNDSNSITELCILVGYEKFHN